MPEVLHLEQRHQTGKDGYGKGAQIRRGSSKKLYDANYDAWFGKKTADVANSPDAGGSVPADGRRNRCFDFGKPSR
jgi:hypothetical protein